MFFKHCILSCFAGAAGNQSQQLKGAAALTNSLEQLQLGSPDEADDLAPAEPLQEQLRPVNIVSYAEEHQERPSCAPEYSATPNPQDSAELRDFLRSLYESYDLRKEAELALDTLGTDVHDCDAEPRAPRSVGATRPPAPDLGPGPEAAPATAAAFHNFTASCAASRCTGLPLAFNPGLRHLSDPNTQHLPDTFTPPGSAQHLPPVPQPLPAGLPPPHGWVNNHAQIQGQWDSQHLLIVPDKGCDPGPGAGLALIDLVGGAGPQEGAPLARPNRQPHEPAAARAHGSDGGGNDDDVQAALLLRSCGLSTLELASALQTLPSAVLQRFPACPLGALAPRTAGSAELEASEAAAAEADAAASSTPGAGTVPLRTSLLGRVPPRRAVSGMAPWPPQDGVTAAPHAANASAAAHTVILTAEAAALQLPPYDLRVFFQGGASEAGFFCYKDGGGDSGHGSPGVGWYGGHAYGHGGEYDGLYSNSDCGVLGRVLVDSPVALLEDVHGLRELQQPGGCVAQSVWKGTWLGRQVMVKLTTCACEGGCEGLPQPAIPRDWAQRSTSERGRDSDAFHSSSGSIRVPVGVEQAHVHRGAAAANRSGMPLRAAPTASGPGHDTNGQLHQQQQRPQPCLSCTSHLAASVAASHLSHPHLARVYNVRAVLVTEQVLCALDLPRGARRGSPLQPAAAVGGAGAGALRRQPAGPHAPGRTVGRLSQLVAESMACDAGAYSPSRGMRQTQHGVVMKEEGQQRGTWSSPPRACSAGYTGAPLPPPCAPSPTSLIALGRLRLVPGDLVTAVIYERCDMGDLQTLACSPGSPFRARGTWPLHMAQRSLLRTAREVAEAVAYLHAHGITHGALKAANVLLTSSRADRRGFVARVADVGSPSAARRAATPHEAGGAMLLCAPELVTAGSPPTPAADAYSFGMLLYIMAAGELPYRSRNLASTLVAVATQGLRPEWPTGQHDHLGPLFRRCVAQQPEDRPIFEQIVTEIRALEDAIRGSHRRRVVQVTNGS